MSQSRGIDVRVGWRRALFGRTAFLLECCVGAVLICSVLLLFLRDLWPPPPADDLTELPELAPWPSHPGPLERDDDVPVMDPRHPQAISVCIERLAGRNPGFRVDPDDLPEASGVPREWPVPGLGKSTRMVRLAPEARVLAIIGRHAQPRLARALAKEGRDARIQILLAMLQFPECGALPEIRDLAARDQNFTVRCLAGELLRKIDSTGAGPR